MNLTAHYIFLIIVVSLTYFPSATIAQVAPGDFPREFFGQYQGEVIATKDGERFELEQQIFFIMRFDTSGNNTSSQFRAVVPGLDVAVGGSLTGPPDNFSANPPAFFNKLEGSATPTTLTFELTDGFDNAEGWSARFSGVCIKTNATCCGFDDVEDNCLALTPTPTPMPVDQFIRWNTGDGSFGVAENWEPTQVPTDTDIVIFDREPPVTVSITSETALSRQAKIERGAVTFAGGAYELSGTSMTPGMRSLEVGTSSSSMVQCNLVSGHAMGTFHSAIGRDAIASGLMVVAGEQVSWLNLGRLSVGLEGTGGLNIDGGAGVIIIEETRIGDEVGSSGLVTVRSTGLSNRRGVSEQLSYLETGKLFVGLSGDGDLTIENAAVRSADVVIGSETGSSGVVNVRQSESRWDMDYLLVGVHGNGTLLIEDGAIVSVDSGIGTFIDNGSHVTVTSTSENLPSELETQPLFISDNSFLTIQENALVVSTGSIVGFSGKGTVLIERSDHEVSWLLDDLDLGSVIEDESGEEVIDGIGTLELHGDPLVRVNGDLEIDEGSTIRGTGEVEVIGDASNEGTIAPGIAGIQDVAKGATGGGPRILIFDGNLTMNGGEILAQVDGTAEGQYDQLIVNGTADFIDSTIRIRVGEDYIPQLGDSFPVVDVTGEFNVENVTVRSESRAFGFDLMVEDGKLIAVTNETNGFDVQPNPRDGLVDSRDLFEWLRAIKEDEEPGDVLFDFAQFWVK